MGRKPRIAAVAIGLITAWSGDAQPPGKFEVASVKISPPGAGETSWSALGGTTFTAVNIPLRILVQMAYAVGEKQLAGEDQLGSEEYDVSAKSQNGEILTSENLKPMLISLLTERFGLVIHRDTKLSPGYTLVIAKGGSKLHASGAAEGQSAILRGRIIGHGADMAVLAAMLGRPLGVPVIDKTGIEGRYDIDLRFAPEGSADTSLPSIFTAIQEQLGLKLESQKIPLEMLVIDHCQRVPTEN
jgi:uncharacterized protein (TIGR03435 family)